METNLVMGKQISASVWNQTWTAGLADHCLTDYATYVYERDMCVMI